MSQSELCCGTCGIVFGVPTGWRDARIADKATFYCPNGHARAFVESEADRLRRQVERGRQEMARLQEEARLARLRELDADRRATAATRDRDRIRKRIEGGACPDCNRTFTNLHRHMMTKHPHPLTADIVKPAAKARGGRRAH